MEIRRSRGSLNPGTPSPNPRGRGHSEPLALVNFHISLFPKHLTTLPNNTDSRPSGSDAFLSLCVFMVAAVSDWILLCVFFLLPPILPSSNVTCSPVLWNCSKLTTVGGWGRVTAVRGGSLGVCGHFTPPLWGSGPGERWRHSGKGPLLIRLPDQIVDQRHTQTKPQVPAGRKAGPMGPPRPRLAASPAPVPGRPLPPARPQLWCIRRTGSVSAVWGHAGPSVSPHKGNRRWHARTHASVRLSLGRGQQCPQGLGGGEGGCLKRV